MKLLIAKALISGALLAAGVAQANIFDSLFGGSANRCEPLTVACLTAEIATEIHDHYPAAEMPGRSRELNGLVGDLYRVARSDGRAAIRRRFADYLVAVPDAAAILDRIDRAGSISADDMLALFDDRIAEGAEVADITTALLIEELVRQGRTEVPARLFRERMPSLLSMRKAGPAALDWAVRHDLDAFGAYHQRYNLRSDDWQLVAYAAHDLCLAGRIDEGLRLLAELAVARSRGAPEGSSMSYEWSRTLRARGACMGWSVAEAEIATVEQMIKEEVAARLSTRERSEGDTERLTSMSWQLKWSNSLRFLAADLVRQGREAAAFGMFVRTDPNRAVMTFDASKGEDAFGSYIEDVSWQEFKQSYGLDQPPVALADGTLPTDSRLVAILAVGDVGYAASEMRQLALAGLTHGDMDAATINEMLLALPRLAEDRFGVDDALAAKLALVALQHRQTGCAVPAELLAAWEGDGWEMEFVGGRVHSLVSLILVLQGQEDQPPASDAAICSGAQPG